MNPQARASELFFSTAGERAILHANSTPWSSEIQPGAVLSATSTTLSGQVLEKNKVYGGRPPRELGPEWSSR